MIIGNFVYAKQLCSANLVVFLMTVRIILSVPFFCLLLFGNLAAQRVEVKWGEDKDAAKVKASGLIGRDTSGFYVYRLNRHHDSYIRIDGYSFEDYSRRQTLNVDLPTLGKRATQFERIFLLNEHFLLFTSFLDLENNQHLAFASLLDKQGNYVKAMVPVDKIEDVTNHKNAGHFAFRLSPDSSYLMAFHNTPFRRYQNASFSVKLFDASLNPLWQRMFRMPYPDEDFEVVTAIADNQQDVFMVCRHHGKGAMRGAEAGANKKYTLVHYSHLDRRLTEFEIKVDNKWIHSARFSLTNDSTLVAAGFYSGSSQGNIAGTFLVRFNTRSGDVVNHGFEPLPRDVMIAVTSNDELLYGGLASFEMKKMLVRPDESIVLIAEKDYVTTSSYFDPYTGQRLITYNYHYEDVLVTSLSPEGVLEWARVVPKSQVSANDPSLYGSIAVNQYADKTYIVFNDHPANANVVRQPGQVRTLSNYTRSVGVIATIDRNGKMTTEALFSSGDFDAILRPDFCSEHENARQIIYGESSGKDKFGEIFYPEN